MDKQTLDKLRYLINKKRSVEEICSILEVEINTLYEMVLYLKAQGKPYDIIDNVPQRVKPDCPGIPAVTHLNIREKFNSEMTIEEKPRFSICLLSDVHYGSLYDRPDIMARIYRECENRGINHIFCSGDFTNGNYSNRPEFLACSRIYKSEDMIDYVANIHPTSDTIKFYTIAGNHDTSFLCIEGIDVIAKIAELRNDIVYLGHDLADICLGPLRMRMYHGYDRKRPSIEDRLTRLYNKIEDDFKPDILQIGHIHHSLYMPIGTTHIFQTAALIDALPVEFSHNMPCERSCWFVTFEYDEEGKIRKVNPELEFFDEARCRKR